MYYEVEGFFFFFLGLKEVESEKIMWFIMQ